MDRVVRQTIDSNVPSVVAVNAGEVQALAVNPQRIGWNIVNVDATVVNVALGSTASATVYHFPLKACSTAGDGTGGSVGQTSGVVFTGAITAYSASSGHIVVLEHGH